MVLSWEKECSQILFKDSHLKDDFCPKVGYLPAKSQTRYNIDSWKSHKESAEGAISTVIMQASYSTEHIKSYCTYRYIWVPENPWKKWYILLSVVCVPDMRSLLIKIKFFRNDLKLNAEIQSLQFKLSWNQCICSFGVLSFATYWHTPQHALSCNKLSCMIMQSIWFIISKPLLNTPSDCIH